MVERSLSVLGYRVRLTATLKHLGELSLSLAVMAAVPAVFGLWSGEFAVALPMLGLALVVLAFALVCRRIRAPRDIKVNEALVVAALAFLLGAFVMTWPLMRWEISFVDALFESVSGITTTGLSALPAIEDRSPVFLLTRAWMQWYGGAIIIVLALALVVGPGAAARRLAGDAEPDDLVVGTRRRSRQVLIVYVGLTAVAVAVIWLFGAAPFDALVHGLATVSTGGFSSHDAGLAGLGGWPLQAVVMVIAVFGAISFSLQYRTWRGGWRALVFDREVQALLLSVVVVSALLAATMALAGAWTFSDIARNAPLMAVSAQTTTGFATLPITDMDPASKLVLIVAMLIGGDVGSTAGGIKIFRLLVILRILQILLARTALPRHAVVETRVAGRAADPQDVQLALGIVALYLVTILASWLPFLALGYNPLDALFEVVSALGTVGLSSGVTGPELPILLKLVLCADMLMGRLEIVAFLILFYPATWIGRKGDTA